jgi:hypothetical protein
MEDVNYLQHLGYGIAACDRTASFPDSTSDQTLTTIPKFQFRPGIYAAKKPHNNTPTPQKPIVDCPKQR